VTERVYWEADSLDPLRTNSECRVGGPTD
jgi:hypothetical protein